MIRFVGLKSLKLRCSSSIRISSVTMLTPVAKFLTISLVVNLFAHSLGSLHHIQDDIFTLPRYKVVLTNEKISNSQVQAKEVESSSNNIIMTSSSGQPFSCIIPDVQIEHERREREKEEQAKEDTEQDINNTIERGLELLQPLGANCMRFYAPTAQYWTYEYCHNRYVRQYHVERTQDGKIEKEVETQSYYLGKYPGISDGEGDKQNDKALSPKKSPKFSEQRLHTSMVKTRDQRHLLVQHWKDGSICDKTQKPRTIEIQFYCDPHGHDHVASFEELTTCHYRIMIATPRLCEEMNLSHRYHTESHKIECRPIVSENLLDQEKSRNLLQAQQDTTDDQALSNEAESAVEVDLGTEKEEIQKLLDSVVSKEAKGDDKLLGLISDLTDQITKLRAQMNTLPNENRGRRAEISLFTLDENGNIIPGVDFNQLIVNNQKKQEPEKSYLEQNQAKDQQNNKQAYHQNYIAQ